MDFLLDELVFIILKSRRKSSNSLKCAAKRIDGKREQSTQRHGGRRILGSLSCQIRFMTFSGE